MKNVTLLAYLLVCISSVLLVQAQDLATKQVPSVILNSFKKEFPKAEKTSWELKKNVYEVEFEVGKADHEAWLDHEGNLIKYKAEMRVWSIPSAVRSAVRREYRGYLITEAERLFKNNQMYYKLELKAFSKEQDVVISPEGVVIPDFLW